ncbi:MAG: orotidine-5'-phosphate decarboxylase [Candidatus Peribacteraceae bacterium]
MHYADRLQERIKKTSPVCVGLDPVLKQLPDGIEQSVKGVEVFCNGIIDAVSDVASCVKPQLAYFEVLGSEGIAALERISAYAQKKGLIVIADAKRGDIGSTASAYAEAYLGKHTPFDAVTVNPYLGSDGVQPFIELATKNEKGVYVLVKTSNESSGELQDLVTGDEAVHEHLAQLVESWGAGNLGKMNLSCLGAVVGATYPEELKYLRTLMPHIPLLIPGYGAQGGKAEDVRHGFLPDGTGAIVNSSRAILYASNGKDWQEKAKSASEAMKNDLKKVLLKN